MSDRYKTKEERDDFLETWGIDLHDDDLHGRDLNDYYEEGKPITFEGWKKLIEDLNELFTNPPGECEAVDEIPLPESPQVWTLEDVEEVREKMIEMCNNIEFDWGWYQPNFEGPDNDLLRFPFGRELIYEMVDQMFWCGCGDDSYSLRELHPALAGCLEDQVLGEPPARTPLSDIISGMQVGLEGNHGTWQFYILRHSTDADAATESERGHWEAANEGQTAPWIVGRRDNSTKRAAGSLDCSGAVVCNESCDEQYLADDWPIYYRCYPDCCDNLREELADAYDTGDEDHIANVEENLELCENACDEARADALSDANEGISRMESEGIYS